MIFKIKIKYKENNQVKYTKWLNIKKYRETVLQLINISSSIVLFYKRTTRENIVRYKQLKSVKE